MASRYAAATCAALTRIGSICFGDRGMKRRAAKAQFWKKIVPGGASGLQIREGPRAGPWWVQLPLSSATFSERRMTLFQAPFALQTLIGQTTFLTFSKAVCARVGQALGALIDLCFSSL